MVSKTEKIKSEKKEYFRKIKSYGLFINQEQMKTTKELKSENFRIGNLVDTPDGVDEIVAIYRTDVITSWMHDLTRIKGIPLTVKILEDSGFIYNERTTHWVYDFTRDGNGRVLWVGEDPEHGLFCTLHNTFTFDDVNVCTVPFVHVLQNVFYYYTGFELDIKL